MSLAAAERLLAYRRHRLSISEDNARAAYNAIPRESSDPMAELAYRDAAYDREWWRRLYHLGLIRLYRARRP